MERLNAKINISIKQLSTKRACPLRLVPYLAWSTEWADS